MRDTKLKVITATNQVKQSRTSSRAARRNNTSSSREGRREDEGSLETDEQDGEEEDEGEEEGGEEQEEDEVSSAISSASIPDENIDFNLVYALHTFNATLDGQTTVVRGDSMQLLDDSNSYWWLVKLTQTEKVGYIPAENIETPYERLARLNRHRNIKMSSSQQHEELGPGKEDISRSKDGEGRRQRRVNFPDSLILPSPTIESDSYFEDEEGDEEEEESEEEQDDKRPDGAAKVSEDKATEQGVQQGNRKEPGEEEDKAKEKDKEKGGGGFFDKIINSMTNRQSASSSTTPGGSNSRTDVSSEEKASASQKVSNSAASADSVDPTEKRPSVANGSAKPYSRIRVFSGNLGGAPLFKTLPVTEETTVQQLKTAAVERFHLKEDGGSEYYLTVKVLNGEETRLNADDRPMDVYRTLHYTVSGDLDPQDPNDVPVKFFLQKRISRVNQRQGQLIFRVLWYPQKNSINDQKSKRTGSLMPTGSKKRGTSLADAQPASYENIPEDDSQVISKLISVGTEATANEVLTLALEKFNVTATSGAQAFPNDDSGYFLVCVVPGEPERVLSPNQPVKELLLDRSGSSVPPTRRTSMNAPAMSSNSQKNPHFDEELHLVLTRKSRTIISSDSTPKRMSSLLGAEKEYRKSFVEGTTSLESLGESGSREQAPVSSRGPQIPDTIDISPLEDIVYTETLAPQERSSSQSRDQLDKYAQQHMAASSSFDSSMGTVYESMVSKQNEVGRENLGTESQSNDTRAEPVAADATTQGPVEAKRGDRADMVIGKGISSSNSFTLRARAKDENTEERSSRRNSSRLRLSLVLTPQDMSFDDGEEVEIDVSDIINDIINGGGEDEEGEEEVLVSQELPVGLQDSAIGSDEFYEASMASEPRILEPVRRSTVQDSSASMSSLASTKSLASARDVSNPSRTGSNPSFGLPVRGDSGVTEESADVMSPDGTDMLDDLEAYLNSLKADLSKEKLGKLETVLNKVKQTAMRRISTTLETPVQKQNGEHDRGLETDEARRDNRDEKRGVSPSLQSKTAPPSLQVEPPTRNGFRSPNLGKGSLYDDAGLNDLLVMVRSGWSDEMIAAAKPGAAPNNKSPKTMETTENDRKIPAETGGAYRQAEEKLNEMEQELDDLMSRVSLNWSTSAGS